MTAEGVDVRGRSADLIEKQKRQHIEYVPSN